MFIVATMFTTCVAHVLLNKYYFAYTSWSNMPSLGQAKTTIKTKINLLFLLSIIPNQNDTWLGSLWLRPAVLHLSFKT